MFLVLFRLMMFSCLFKIKSIYCFLFKDIGLVDFGIIVFIDLCELWFFIKVKINVVRINVFFWCNIWCFYNVF